MCETALQAFREMKLKYNFVGGDWRAGHQPFSHDDTATHFLPDTPTGYDS